MSFRYTSGDTLTAIELPGGDPFMNARDFVEALLDDGRVVVDAPGVPLSDLSEAATLLDRAVRPTLPDQAPPLNLAAAVWAINRIYLACQFLVFREVDETLIAAALREPCPEPRSPSIIYSCDLILQTLPDIHRLASAVSEADPLVAELRRLGSDWPLSSVGLPAMGNLNVELIAEDPCLLLYYIDRIIERRDVSRMQDARVRNAVVAAIGAFTELSPEMVGASLATSVG